MQEEYKNISALADFFVKNKDNPLMTNITQFYNSYLRAYNLIQYFFPEHSVTTNYIIDQSKRVFHFSISIDRTDLYINLSNTDIIVYDKPVENGNIKIFYFLKNDDLHLVRSKNRYKTGRNIDAKDRYNALRLLSTESFVSGKKLTNKRSKDYSAYLLHIDVVSSLLIRPLRENSEAIRTDNMFVKLKYRQYVSQEYDSANRKEYFLKLLASNWKSK